MGHKKSTAWRLPFRYKKNGRMVGSFYTREPGGKDVNLRTQDAAKALARLAEAKKGKRIFEDDGAGAAAAVAAAVVGTGDPPRPPVVEPAAPATSSLPAPPAPLPPTYTAPPALPPVPPVQTAESPPGASPGASSVRPDAYIPPQPGWADAVRDAAGTEGPAGEGEAEVDAEFLNELVGTMADILVEAQLMGQAWLIKKRAGLEAGSVPENAKGRTVGRAVWTRAIKKAFPETPDIPEWLLAPLAIAALTVPTQIQNGTPIKKEPQAEEGAAAPVAAAA